MIKIIAIGDVYLGLDVFQNSIINKCISELFKSTDIVLGNLEGPFTNDNKDPINGDFGLYSHPDSINLINNYNINLFSLGNNHISDFGEGAVSKTCEILRSNNIDFYGWHQSSKNIEPFYKSINGINISFISISLHEAKRASENSSGTLDPKYSISIIQEAKKNSDFRIVSVHWGKETYIYPDPSDISFAHKLIDSGADLIIGHHPHIIQGMEAYKDKYIFYSLGNFLFNSFSYKNIRQKLSLEARTTFFLEVILNKNGIESYSVNPIYFDEDLNLFEFDESEKKLFLEYFVNISKKISEPDYGKFFKNYQIQKKFPVKKRTMEILKSEEFTFSLIPRFFKILKKWIKLVLFNK